MEFLFVRIKGKNRPYYIVAEIKGRKNFNAIFNATPGKSYKKV